MPKQRRTKKAKIMATQRKHEAIGFVIKDEWLKSGAKKNRVIVTPIGSKYFKADLTKTVLLTMLVLALELAIWNYLSRH